jgi:thiol-disulfide isomerase/thioredoxin
MQYPSDWKEVETARLLENPAFRSVSVIRFKTREGNVSYVVDTNGDLDFRQESILQFRQVDKLQIADFEVVARALDDKETGRKVAYQILVSLDGYVYGRISEYREGEIRLADRTHAIRLTPLSRNTPLFGLSGETVCSIDLNRDGDFSTRWKISESGDIVPREDVEMSNPFILDGQKLKIISLDPAGNSLKFQPTTEEISISPGFQAPSFSIRTIDNAQYTLANLKGKIVLLQFWSVSCPFCKSILPEVNALIKKNAGEDLVALDIAREEDANSIKSNVKEFPRNARVTVRDQAAWETFDRQVITPTFYLIDQRGVVRLSAAGASLDQLKVIDRMVENIRRGK